MPQRTLDLGDPYHCHCRKTARLLGGGDDANVDPRFPAKGQHDRRHLDGFRARADDDQDASPPAPGFVAPACFLESSCDRSDEHTSELQSLMRISYAVFCLNNTTHLPHTTTTIRIHHSLLY